MTITKLPQEREALYVIELAHKNQPASWRYWSMRFTEKSARKWIGKSQLKFRELYS